MTFKSWVPIWLFSQLFWYQYMTPQLSFSLGLRISPDRLIFLIMVASFINGRRRAWNIGPIEIFMAAFTLLSTGSWLLAGSDTDGSSLRWLTTLFQLTYFPYSIYYMSKNGNYTEQDIQRLLGWLLGIQAYLAVTGLIEHYRIDFLIWPKYIIDESIGDQWERLRGPFINSSLLGAALVFSFAATATIGLYATRGRKWVLYSVMLFTMLCVYFTYTRTVWLGFFATLLIFAYLKTGVRRVARMLLGLLIVAFVLGVGSKLSMGNSTLFSRRQNTVEYRKANMELAITVFKKHPVFGLGYGKFGKELRSFEDSYGDNPDMALTSGNENTVFGLLTELGLLGFSLYIAVFYFALKSCITVYRRLAETEDLARALAVVGVCMITYFSLNSMTGDLRFHLLTHNIMFLILGIVGGIEFRILNTGYRRPVARVAGADLDSACHLNAGRS